MSVELDFVMDVDGGTLSTNYPTDDGWVIDIYLKKLRARDNTNVVNLAQKINRLYLLEYICAEMQQLHGEFNEDTYCKVGVSSCVIEEIVKQMV